MDIRAQLEQRKGQRDQILKNIETIRSRVKETNKEIRTLEQAQGVIRQVGITTQQQLTYNISEVTSMALQSVLADPYDLKLEFVERRNKTECDIYLSRGDDLQIDPFSAGGGAVDIAAFALRVSSWSMQNPRSRNTLILDEPFKHLKGEEANRKMLEMVRQISDKLKLQIIMISDERVSREATIEATDKLFETSIKKGVTKIEEI